MSIKTTHRISRDQAIHILTTSAQELPSSGLEALPCGHRAKQVDVKSQKEDA